MGQPVEQHRQPVPAHRAGVPGSAPLVSDLIDESGSIVIGPIPQGTPINLLFNIDIDVDLRDMSRLKQLIALFVKIKKALVEVKAQNLAGDAAVERLKALVPDLLAASKCPDFVTDRGHTFGTDLPDADKRALIELFKFI